MTAAPHRPAPARSSLLSPGLDLTLRPMRYPQFYERFRDAIKNTWTVEEVDLLSDVTDLAALTPAERHLVGRLVAFFATGDAIVSNNLVLNRGRDQLGVPRRVHAPGVRVRGRGRRARREPDLFDAELEAAVRTMLAEAVECEVQFAEDLLGQGVPGLSLADVRDYLPHVADQRLAQLGLPAAYGSANPFGFLELQDVQERSNFFERRVSAYQTGVGGVVPFEEDF